MSGMDLNTYFERPGAESMVDFAQGIDANPDQVRQWRHGYMGRRPGQETCLVIERATEGLVTCEELRDDITWRRVKDKAWPWHPAGKPLVDALPAEA